MFSSYSLTELVYTKEDFLQTNLLVVWFNVSPPCSQNGVLSLRTDLSLIHEYMQDRTRVPAIALVYTVFHLFSLSLSFSLLSLYLH